MTLRARLALWFVPITLALVLVPWWLTRPELLISRSSPASESSRAGFSATPTAQARDQAGTATPANAPPAEPTIAQEAPREQAVTPSPLANQAPRVTAPNTQAAPSPPPARPRNAPAVPSKPATPAPITTAPSATAPSATAPSRTGSGPPPPSVSQPDAPDRAEAKPAPDQANATSGATADVIAPQGQLSALQQQLEGLKDRQEPVLLRYTNGKLEVLESPSTAPAGPTWLWAGVLLAGAWLAGAWGIRRSLGPLYTLAAEIARRGPTRLDALEPPPLPELRPAVTALNKLLEELRGTLSRLELQEQSARRFAYNASHELRNPLTAARNYLEVLTRHPNEREAGIKALEAVQRTEKVLGSLLTLARLEGRGRVRGEAVDVRGFLEANFELRVVGDATVWAERDLLELAVDNIVKNAEDHASGVRQARIETTPSGVWLWLEDDGPGFAPEIMAHAFEPFVRGSPNNNRSSTGLGLAIVDAVARAHGGEVRAENRADGGARVGLRLPSGSS